MTVLPTVVTDGANLRTDTSALSTLVVVDDVLSPGSSPGVVVLIVALLLMLLGAPFVMVVLTVMVPLVPAANVPRLQVRVWPLTLVGAGLDETKAAPAGNVSTSLTCWAALGPSL